MSTAGACERRVLLGWSGSLILWLLTSQCVLLDTVLANSGFSKRQFPGDMEAGIQMGSLEGGMIPYDGGMGPLGVGMVSHGGGMGPFGGQMGPFGGGMQLPGAETIPFGEGMIPVPFDGGIGHFGQGMVPLPYDGVPGPFGGGMEPFGMEMLPVHGEMAGGHGGMNPMETYGGQIPMSLSLTNTYPGHEAGPQNSGPSRQYIEPQQEQQQTEPEKPQIPLQQPLYPPYGLKDPTFSIQTGFEGFLVPHPYFNLLPWIIEGFIIGVVGIIITCATVAGIGAFFAWLAGIGNIAEMDAAARLFPPNSHSVFGEHLNHLSKSIKDALDR